MEPNDTTTRHFIAVREFLLSCCIWFSLAVRASGWTTPEQCRNVEVLSQIRILPGRVEVAGDYAYFCEGRSLSILDVSDPSALTPVARLWFEDELYEVRDVKISGGFAYVVTRDFLRIYDVTDPRAPLLRGSYGFRHPYAVYVVGGTAYVATSDLWILDVSDPSSPTLRGFLDLSQGPLYGIQGQGNLVCAVSAGGLFTIDVSDPSSPTVVGSYGSGGTDLFLSGNRAFVSNHRNGLKIIEVGNPSSPTLLGSWLNGIHGSGVHVVGHRAYLADRRGGLQILDVSDPSSPTLQATVDFLAAFDVFVSGDTAYCSMERGLQAVDVHDPTSPTLLGDYSLLAGFYYSVHVSDGLAYVTGSIDATYAPFYIFDVRNPRVPAPQGFCWVRPDSYDVFAASGLAFVRVRGGLEIIDVSDVSSPRPVGLYPIHAFPEGVVETGGTTYLVVIAGEELQFLDLTDPTSPTLHAVYEPPGDPEHVCISGTTAYVCEYGGPMHILDISDPSSPVVLGTWPGVREVEVVGNIAYLGMGGIQILDVSDPSSPTRLGLSAASWRYRVAASDNLVFLYGPLGFDVIDASDPTSPTTVGSFLMARGQSGYEGTIREMDAYGGVAYIAGDWSGVWAVGYTGPRVPATAVWPAWRQYR